MNDKGNNIADLTFEQAYQELEEIVQKLEVGQIDLAQSVEKYERGENLKQHCEKLLKSAELKITKLKTENDNIISGEDFEVSNRENAS